MRKIQTSDGLPNTRRYRRQAAALPVPPPVGGTLQYLAKAIEGFTVVLLYYSSARGSFENPNQNAQEGRENRAPQPSR